ncbi:uncharacterized protein LOC120389385 [Mauremys reevesii]|uniref:uncharacterized protein LOC120389385 n=1 Tax=Mauremys reevesii TaxID=260615 RepID=UPI00193FC85B|nr:uncharacterized protein LOC120389385 [Mauremys reevesii]
MITAPGEGQFAQLSAVVSPQSLHGVPGRGAAGRGLSLASGSHLALRFNSFSLKAVTKLVGERRHSEERVLLYRRAERGHRPAGLASPSPAPPRSTSARAERESCSGARNRPGTAAGLAPQPETAAVPWLQHVNLHLAPQCKARLHPGESAPISVGSGQGWVRANVPEVRLPVGPGVSTGVGEKGRSLLQVSHVAPTTPGGTQS